MMKRLLKYSWVVFLLVFGMSVATAASGGVDDFETDLSGWRVGGGVNAVDPTIQANGMGGATDDYMQVVSGAGGSSRMAVLNRSAKWTGDYTAVNIGQVTMDVRSSGTDDLNVRLALGELTGGGGTQWVSTAPCVVTAGSGWQMCVFTISEAAMTQTTGTTSFNGVVTDVLEFRIVSNVTASHQGDQIEAVMDVDNITPQTPTAVTMSQQGVELGQNTLLMAVLFVVLSSVTIGVYGRAWLVARSH